MRVAMSRVWMHTQSPKGRSSKKNTSPAIRGGQVIVSTTEGAVPATAILPPPPLRFQLGKGNQNHRQSTPVVQGTQPWEETTETVGLQMHETLHVWKLGKEMVIGANHTHPFSYSSPSPPRAEPPPPGRVRGIRRVLWCLAPQGLGPGGVL